MINVQRWDNYEIALNAVNKYANPFVDIDVTARFTHEGTGKTVDINGFFDGGSTWRLRYMPSELGKWSYITFSRDSGLNGKEGVLACINPIESYLHGPLTIHGNHFFHTDRTPCFLISTRVSCHLSSPEVWGNAIEYLKAHEINRIFFMLGGIMGTTGLLFGDGPDFWRYNIESFQAIDTFIDSLRHAEIIASPYFYYFNDGIQRDMTREQDNAFIKYGMARFGAYANVMPVLGNEVEQKFTTKRDSGDYNLQSHTWCNEIGKYLKELAVFGNPVTIHNPMESFVSTNPGFYSLLRSWPFPWADCMLRQAQVGALGAATEIGDDIHENTNPVYNARGYARHNELLAELRKFGIPVINEEPGYEMAGYNSSDCSQYTPLSWNSQTPDTLISTFWTAFTAGAYVTWGHLDTYELGNPLPGIKRTITPKYLKVMHEFVKSIPYVEMEPMNELVSASAMEIEGVPYRTNFCLAIKGDIYLVFSLNGGELEMFLEAGEEYKVEQMDPRTGFRSLLGFVGGGKQKIIVDGKEQVILFCKSIDLNV